MIGTVLVRVLSDAPNHRLREFDKQQAVIASIIAEDVGEGWRENYAESELSQRPCPVPPRANATQSLTLHPERCRAEVLVVEPEVLALAAIRMIAPVEK